MIQQNLIYNSPLICFTYIIEGVDGWMYCGITNDLQGRLKQHNSDEKKYKSIHAPYKYVYAKRLYSRKEAHYYERGIKAYGVKRWYNRELISGRMQVSRIIIESLEKEIELRALMAG